MNDKVFKSEIEELTHRLRSEVSWTDLRCLITSKGLDPEKTWLLAFCESEDNKEFGFLLTSQGHVIEYSRHTNLKEEAFTMWRRLRKPERVFKSCPNVEVGVRLFATRKD